MNKLLFVVALLLASMAVNAQHLGSEYRLKKVIPVAGRQGIAIDSNYYYVSDTKVLYKYDKHGNLIMKNDQPFQNPEIANHFGDIDIYNGEIYCGIEKFEYGRGYNIAVSIYDAETLKWKRDLPWSPESGQVLPLTARKTWFGCPTGWIAVTCIATALKQDNTIPRCNAARPRTGVKVFSSLTVKCFSLQMTVNHYTIFLTTFTLPTSLKYTSPDCRTELKLLRTPLSA